MLTRKILILPFYFFLLFYAQADAQQTQESIGADVLSTNSGTSYTDTLAVITIQNIIIEGNKHTKQKVILRELTFKEGEQYPLHRLKEKFALAKQQLLNTTLFQQVEVSLNGTEGNAASVFVWVKERWYIFPVPFADIVDNSMQEWVKKMDFNRINYGIKMRHRNFSGLRDVLNLDVTLGYTKGFILRYEGLSLDPALKWAASFSTSFGSRHDVGYATVNNRRLSYTNHDRFVHNYFQSGAAVSYRPAIKTTHAFGINYISEKFNDTIAALNKKFFFDHNKVSYPEFFYNVDYRDLDFVPYPTSGYHAYLVFQKKGWNKPVDLWQLTARTSAFWPLSPAYFINLQLAGMIKLPFEQPYAQQGFIGHHNLNLQGYEGYAIDGVAGGYAKASIHKNLLNKRYHFTSQRFRQLNDVPVKVYAKAFGNAGYIYNQQPGTNTLNNRFIYSVGLGLDIILFYDFTLRLQYSLNHLGQNRVYLHDKNSF